MTVGELKKTLNLYPNDYLIKLSGPDTTEPLQEIIAIGLGDQVDSSENKTLIIDFE